MALLNCRFHSDVLDMETTLTALVPEHAERPSPVLYLLHGLSDDDSSWLRQTSLERYAEAYGLAVIMPRVERSYYTDMARGPAWYRFLSEELPVVSQRLFPISQRREETFVAGLSMGGYGAFKWALRDPERFAAAASLSGSLDIVAVGQREAPPPEYPWIFEHPPAGSDDDLLALLERYRQPRPYQPALFQWCGREDFLYEANLRFRDACRETTLTLEYSDGPGDHQWRYWDRQIQRVLRWLPLERPRRG
ncbi:alpha/beta hydrolase [Kushneria phosphatilytica]|uniref:Esterase family protein n=1 Tax=Kushneria phosphatilytica TaxID=657387 RepID=A0A1S1NSZ6_9GAMM|nr:alpha/beta hydrolase family protein [Kushneria phosphatilytica]OHV08464.1 esterase [Kushneria phosphatilytica]QEL09897.1 esterase family protein [Kushneria phosphatilytica]